MSLTVVSQTHFLYIGSGYSFSLKDGVDDDTYGSITAKGEGYGQVTFKDARPRIAEGFNYFLGYNYGFKDRWGINAEIAYLDGIAWRRKVYNQFNSYEWFTTESESYWARVSVNYTWNAKKNYTRRDGFKERIHGTLAIGPSIFKATVINDYTSSDGTPEDRFFHLRYYHFENVGYGVHGRLGIGYQIGKNVVVNISVRAEYASYTTDAFRQTINRVGAAEQPEVIRHGNNTKYSFNNITPSLSLAYTF